MGVILKGQREGKLACKKTFSMATFLKIQKAVNKNIKSPKSLRDS